MCALPPSDLLQCACCGTHSATLIGLGCSACAAAELKETYETGLLLLGLVALILLAQFVVGLGLNPGTVSTASTSSTLPSTVSTASAALSGQPLACPSAPPSQYDPRFMTPLQALELLPARGLSEVGWNLTLPHRDAGIQARYPSEDAALVFSATKVVSSDRVATVYPVAQITNGTALTWYDGPGTIRRTEGLPPAVTQVDVNVTVQSSPPTTWRYLVFQRVPGSNLTEAVLSWIVTAPFVIGGADRAANMTISIYSNLPSLVNAGAIDSSTDYSGTEHVLAAVAQPIASFWYPLQCVAP